MSIQKSSSKKEFTAVFQLSKMCVFEISYYTCGNNPKPYFATRAAEFVRNKQDYKTCGQCQDRIVKFITARKFWKKWDCKHLSDLTIKEYHEMISDMEELKKKYNYIIKPLDELKKPYNSNIPFYQIVELSKLTPKYQTTKH